MEIKPVATTFDCGFNDNRFDQVASFITDADELDNLKRNTLHLWKELKLLFNVLKASRKPKTMLLFSSRGVLKPELLAIILLSFLPKRKRPTVVLYGEMFQPNSGFAHLIERIFMRLVDRGVTLYSVYTTQELTLFPEIWGISPDKMRFCQFYMDPERTNYQPNVKRDPDMVFAGGISKREYGPLIEAAHLLPEVHFYLATTYEFDPETLPANVTVEWPDLPEYVGKMNEAALIVIPLKTGLKRTIGLLTILEAMTLEQLVISSNAMGVEDYITEGETGMIVPPTAEGYAEAIRWAMDPFNAAAVQRIREQARRAVLEDFSLESLVTQMLKILDEAQEIKDRRDGK